jgi:cell wall-associated NlpC family hydrolase
VALFVALVVAVPALANPSIDSKRQQAEAAQAQLLQLSDSLERARAQYDASSAKLAHIHRDLKQNRHEYTVARHNLKTGETMIAARVANLYMTDQTSTLEVILGASSLDDMITRLDNAKSVTDLDANVIAQVKSFHRTVQRSGALLAREQKEQQQVVAERAAAKRTIEVKISEQQQLYNSLKNEIDRLVAAQHARQLQMAHEAAMRFQAAQLAARDRAQTTVVGITATGPQQDTIIAPPSTHGGVVGVALSQLGTPYVWAGSSPGGFDCSGLVMWSFAQVGVSLPHSSYAMYGYGVPVSRDQLEPGDIVFFDGLGHVGIYIGADQFVHAPHTGDVVKISSLDDPWYAANYAGARRIL